MVKRCRRGATSSRAPRVEEQKPVSIHGREKGHGPVDDEVGGDVAGRGAVVEFVLDDSRVDGRSMARASTFGGRAPA